MQRWQITRNIKRKELVGGLWHEKVPIVMPLTYMNHSGKAVAAYAKKRSVKPENILVLHDELDFPVGRLQFKFGGSEGGHNGLTSISTQLGSRDYWRLRIGIGRPTHKEDVTGHVLGNPPPAERAVYSDLADGLLENLEEFVEGNRETAIRKLAELRPG